MNIPIEIVLHIAAFLTALPILFWLRAKLDGVTARIEESIKADLAEIKRLKDD